MYTGPDIVQDGLIFAIDAGSERCYPGTGTVVTDLVGSNTGTLTNGVAFSADNGGTWDFDGTDDYINITNYTGHQSSTGTIEAWVKLDEISSNRYVFGAGGTYTRGASRALRVIGGYWGVVTYGSSTQDWGTGVQASTTEAQHVAFGWNGTTLYFYINGVRTSVVRTGVVTPLGSILRIGMPPWSVSSPTDGKIATLRCYSNVLTEEEIKQNYNAQKSRFI